MIAAICRAWRSVIREIIGRGAFYALLVSFAPASSKDNGESESDGFFGL
jgi:hypothetical protein